LVGEEMSRPPRVKSPDPEKEIMELFQRVFRSDEGQKVLSILGDAFHLTTSSYHPSDPHETSFREGERNVVLTIMRWVGDDLAPMAVQNRISYVQRYFDRSVQNQAD
jgi:hypothetical protein